MVVSSSDANEKRRARRLEKRKEALASKHCLNCDILLAARLIDSGRSFLYCRKCLTEYRAEARRNRWKRYYERNHERLKEQMRLRAKARRAKV